MDNVALTQQEQMRLRVLRYALLALGSRALLCFGVTAMIPYGPSGIGPDPWGNWLRCLPGDLSIRSRVAHKASEALVSSDLIEA